MDLIRVFLPRIDPQGKAIGMKPVTTFQPDTLGFIIPLIWAASRDSHWYGEQGPPPPVTRIPADDGYYYYPL